MLIRSLSVGRQSEINQSQPKVKVGQHFTHCRLPITQLLTDTIIKEEPFTPKHQ